MLYIVPHHNARWQGRFRINYIWRLTGYYTVFILLIQYKPYKKLTQSAHSAFVFSRSLSPPPKRQLGKKRWGVWRGETQKGERKMICIRMIRPEETVLHNFLT